MWKVRQGEATLLHYIVRKWQELDKLQQSICLDIWWSPLGILPHIFCPEFLCNNKKKNSNNNSATFGRQPAVSPARVKPEQLVLGLAGTRLLNNIFGVLHQGMEVNLQWFRQCNTDLFITPLSWRSHHSNLTCFVSLIKGHLLKVMKFGVPSKGYTNKSCSRKKETVWASSL